MIDPCSRACKRPRRGDAWSLRGRNSRLPQDRRSGLVRASAARRARRAAHRMCAVQSALIRALGTSFSLNMTRTSKQELKMYAQAKPERPKGEGHGWPEFYSPQMRHQGRGDSGFSLSRLPTAQTPCVARTCVARKCLARPRPCRDDRRRVRHGLTPTRSSRQNSLMTSSPYCVARSSVLRTSSHVVV